MRIKNLFNIALSLVVFNSCNFKKSNTVYNSFKGDKTLVFYLTFNGDNDDKSNLNFKKQNGETMFDTDRFDNENSAALFTKQAFLSYGDILDSVFSGENKRFTFSFWIKPKNSGSNVSLICKNADSNCEENNRQFNLKLTQDNYIQFLWLYNNSQYNGYRMFESAVKLIENKWQNVIITYDGLSNGGDGAFRPKLYVNGVNEEFIYKEKRGRLGYIEDKSAHLAIGTMVSSQGEMCSNNFFKGSLDDIMIFERVITVNEIELISSYKQ